MGLITENIHEGEAIIEGNTEQEAREGKDGETVGEGSDNTGQGANQVTENKGRDAPVPIGNVTQQQTTGDAATEEERLRKRCLAAFITHPIQLPYTKMFLPVNYTLRIFSNQFII